MSEYIKALSRLRDTQASGVGAPLAKPRPASAPTPAPTASVSALPHPAVAEAYKTFYDNLRLVVAGEAQRRLVIAGADDSQAAELVADGLGDYIGSLGFRVLRAELCLVQGRPILRRRREQSLASLSNLGLEFAADLTPLDLSSDAAQAQVTEWLAAASRVADVVLVQGCALNESVDAALLARSCDGLIVVAHAGVTDRTTLAEVADRVRASGCRALGLVLFGARRPLPTWLRRFFAPLRPTSSLEE